MLFHLSHTNDVDHAWASSRTKEELDRVVEPFVQAKRQTGQWTQEDEAGYQLYRQETDPEKRTFRVWYLIANPRGLPKEFVQKELEFRWKLFANRDVYKRQSSSTALPATPAGSRNTGAPTAAITAPIWALWVPENCGRWV